MTQRHPDLAPITRHLRAKASSHLLVAAVHHFPLFEILAAGPQPFDSLQRKLLLARRPAMVLFPALCAMNLLRMDNNGELGITILGAYLHSAHPDNLTGYLALEKEDPGVLRLVQWLKNDGPADTSLGMSYVKDEHAPSPMDDPETARFFTLALAGRARYLSPVVAAHLTAKTHLLDVACGTGYYSYEWLAANPGSTATLFDRHEVLHVAAELLEQDPRYAAMRLKERVQFVPGDMLTDELPQADLLLAASLFHDWPEEVCGMLAGKFAAALRPGGEIWIHDAFLNDTLDGPVAVTDYSAMLFLATKGRAYSRREYRGWLTQAGLEPAPRDIPTLMDYGLIYATKSV